LRRHPWLPLLAAVVVAAAELLADGGGEEVLECVEVAWQWGEILHIYKRICRLVKFRRRWLAMVWRGCRRQPGMRASVNNACTNKINSQTQINWRPPIDLAPVGLSLHDACSAGTRERDYARPSTSLRVLAPPACPAGCSGPSPSRVTISPRLRSRLQNKK
jgi:hypothetical protein